MPPRPGPPRIRGKTYNGFGHNPNRHKSARDKGRESRYWLTKRKWWMKGLSDLDREVLRILLWEPPITPAGLAAMKRQQFRLLDNQLKWYMSRFK